MSAPDPKTWAGSTPGPWEVSCVRTRLGCTPVMQINSETLGGVAFIPFSDRTDEEYLGCRADAALIAAAPDLAADVARLTAERNALAEDRERIMRELWRLREALTPSAETKAAYIGEFSFRRETVDADGLPYVETILVPWTTVKEIMAAIRARAALEGR